MNKTFKVNLPKQGDSWTDSNGNTVRGPEPAARTTLRYRVQAASLLGGSEYERCMQRLQYFDYVANLLDKDDK